MDPSEAREHLDLVEQILTRSDRNVAVIGDLFLIWGMVPASIDVVIQLVQLRQLAPVWLWVPFAFLVFAFGYTIVRVRGIKASADRLTTVTRDYLNVLWVVYGLTAIMQVAAFRLFPAWSGAALWSLAGAMVTLYIALNGNRVAMLGGCVLLASLVLAGFVALPGYVLAGGTLIGYAGFGVASMLSRK